MIVTESPPLTTASPTISPLPSQTRIVIGVTICIIGNILVAIALNVQKHAHNKVADTEKSYVTSGTWWLGLLLLIGGEIGNFMAYGFAPASVVAPLGSSGIIFNAIIAVVVLKEKIRLRDVVGIVWAVVGAYLIVTFAKEGKHMPTASKIVFLLRQYTFLAFILVEVCIFVFIVYLHHGMNRISVVSIVLQVALLGSPTVISAKAVSSMISITFWGKNQLIYPIFYIMLVVLALSGVGQVKYLNQAMASYDASVVMPINFIFFSLVAILSGIVFYQEFGKLTILQIAMTLLGACLSFGGVYLICGGREKKDGYEGDALLSDEQDPDIDVPMDNMVASESKVAPNTE